MYSWYLILSQISLKNSFGKVFFKFSPKSKWRKKFFFFLLLQFFERSDLLYKIYILFFQRNADNFKIEHQNMLIFGKGSSSLLNTGRDYSFAH